MGIVNKEISILIEYLDRDGNLFLAQQLLGPTVLTTSTGEFVGEAGQWHIINSSGVSDVVSDSVFNEFFRLKDTD